MNKQRTMLKTHRKSRKHCLHKELQNEVKLSYLAACMMRGRISDMSEKNEDINFEEVLDSEIDDIWDIFFPYMAEKSEQKQKISSAEKSKHRRNLKFLSM